MHIMPFVPLFKEHLHKCSLKILHSVLTYTKSPIKKRFHLLENRANPWRTQKCFSADVKYDSQNGLFQECLRRRLRKDDSEEKTFTSKFCKFVPEMPFIWLK